RVDVAVFRPSTGTWYVRGVFTAGWGAAGDIPVPGDYDGDGRVDVAVFRPSNGTWYVRGRFTWAWGGAGAVPVRAVEVGTGGRPGGGFLRSIAAVSWQ